MNVKEIDREAAMMWLNDRLGQLVNLNMMVDCGAYSAIVLETHGTLSHWREGSDVVEIAALDPSGRREDMVGLYSVGGSGLDISARDLPCEFSLRRSNPPPELGTPTEMLLIGVGVDAEIQIISVGEGDV